MSTYYYMVCDKHRERVNATSLKASGSCGPLGNSIHDLPAFIVRHRGCPVRIIDEHAKESTCPEFTEFVNELTGDA